jgi:hypothetical protein
MQDSSSDSKPAQDPRTIRSTRHLRLNSNNKIQKTPQAPTFVPPRPAPDADRSAPVGNFYYNYTYEAWFLNDDLVLSEDFPNIALLGVSESLLAWFNSRISESLIQN